MSTSSTSEQQTTVSSIRETLLEEARRNELRLAYLRAAWALAFTGFYLVSHLVPHWAGYRNYPLIDLFVMAAWSLVALALLAALRGRWFQPWLRFAVPAADGLMIWVMFFLFWEHVNRYGADIPIGVVVAVTVLCAFLAFSGALRLMRGAAALSTVLALAIFGFVAYAVPGLSFAHVAVTGVTLVIIGALGMGVAGIVRRSVLTEVKRVRAEHRYREAQREVLAAQRAAEAREEVLNIVAHDLRNPLGTISMGSALLLDMVPEGHERALERKQLGIIQRNADRMNQMVQDLLDVARIESGRLAVEPRPEPVSAVLAEAMEMLQPLAASKGIELASEAELDLPPALMDSARVLQVLSNLVGNAVKFTPAGGEIRVRAEQDGDVIRVAVTDTGTGIPAEHLARLFDRFWQASRTDRRGIGLGLAITRGIVEAHGGQIWAESQVGRGSTFFFTIPMAQADRGVTAHGSRS